MNYGKEFQMEDIAKKLSLWHTKTFRPILTHEELEPIMASVGFVPLPMSLTSASSGGGGGGGGHVAWREYAFRSESRRGSGSGGGGGGFSPRPRLPFPRIDGLHILAYEAFFHALEFYLGSHHVPDLFHVRSMTIRAQDMIFHSSYRPMRDCGFDDEGIFVYRDGTLDNVTKMVCNYDNNDSSSSTSSMNNSTSSKESKESRKSSNNPICLVPLDDLFPRMDIVSLG